MMKTAKTWWESGDTKLGQQDIPKCEKSFLLNTKLQDGRMALLLDIGSVGNLMSRAWAKAQSTLAYAAGYKSREKKRKVPLRISGIGEGCQLCDHDCVVPVSIKDEQGTTNLGTFEAPLAPGNSPALMGRVSME